jgi:hypothetical protein
LTRATGLLFAYLVLAILAAHVVGFKERPEIVGRLVVHPPPAGFLADRHYVHPLIWDAGAAYYAAIPPRPWLLGNIVCRRFLTLMFGSGGVGKSSIALAIAMSMATGQNLIEE